VAMAGQRFEVIGVQRERRQLRSERRQQAGMEGMGMRHHLHVRPPTQNLGMDGPFGMPAALALELVTVEADQYEIFMGKNFAQTARVALEPEAAAFWVAQRKVAQRHVAMTLHFEYAACRGQLIELFLKHHCKLSIR